MRRNGTAWRAAAMGVLALAFARLAPAGPCVTCSGQPVGWWDDRPLDFGTTFDHAPRVDVDQSAASTSIAIAFERRSGGDGDVWLVTSPNGGCAQDVRAVTSGPEDDRSPDVAVSLAANAIAIAFERDGAVHATVSLDGGATFPIPVRLHPTAGITPGSRPRLAAIAVAGVLHVHVVWEDAGRLVLASHATGGAGGPWTAAVLSDRIASRDAWLAPDVAADTRSQDASTHSAVTIVASARRAGGSVFEAVAMRSNDSGTTFHGNPPDPSTLDAPRTLSDPRPDVAALGVESPVLDVSDDGSGEFYSWELVGFTDNQGVAQEARADARAEEGAIPTLVSDWNDPPAPGDVVVAMPGEVGAVSVIPNPLQRPPAPEAHVVTVAGPTARAWRGQLDVNARPTVVSTCDPYDLTGVDPPAPSSSVVPGSLSADEDHSHVLVAWADTRDGGSSVYWKRTDTVVDAPIAVVVSAGSCAVGGGFMVRWRLPSTPNCDVSHVRIEHGLAPGATDGSVDVTPTTTTSAHVTGVAAGATVHVRVVAVDEACNEAAAPEVAILTMPCGIQCPNVVGPTLRAAKRPTAEDVELTWLAPPTDATHDAATSHDVYRSITRAQDGFQLLGNVGSPRFEDLGAAAPSEADRHFYLVVARNACGTSGDEPAP